MGVEILIGDCRQHLDTMPAASVQCCVTSPPYFGLRDYDVAGQIGLEPTPAEYVAEMIAVFRKVHRVLRNDGVLWLNLGDSYAGSWGNYGGQNRSKPGGQRPVTSGSRAHQKAYDGKEKWRPPTANKLDGLKPKDLLMIPARVALALQADGWWLRSDIIWHKPNPMPESVTDRPTCAHEHVFLLTKSARYFYDADAIREPLAASSLGRLAQNVASHAGSYRANGGAKINGPMKAVARVDKQSGHSRRHAGFNERWDDGQKSGSPINDANARNVWAIATEPFAGAHFATFPPALAERCIRAGTRFHDTVLDPFGGAGTTGLVADRLQRNAILIELNPGYAQLARSRIAADRGPMAPFMESEPPSVGPIQKVLF